MPATAISTGVAEAVYRTVSGIPGKRRRALGSSSRQLNHQAVTAAATDTHGLIQRRPLAVKKPGDRCGQEADHVADAVVSGHGPAPFTLSAVPITRLQRRERAQRKDG